MEHRVPLFTKTFCRVVSFLFPFSDVKPGFSLGNPLDLSFHLSFTFLSSLLFALFSRSLRRFEIPHIVSSCLRASSLLTQASESSQTQLYSWPSLSSVADPSATNPRRPPPVTTARTARLLIIKVTLAPGVIPSKRNFEWVEYVVQSYFHKCLVTWGSNMAGNQEHD